MTALLAQRYDILDELGSGGQATTRLALDTTTGQRVVVKQLHLAHLENWKAIELFERECSVLAQLDHPAIPSYVDAFHDSSQGQSERFVLVQEYIEGDTLHALIAQGTRFEESEIISLLEGVLHILDYLHHLSPPVVHRDIKPSNLIRRPDGSWALIDFGAIQAILSEASKVGSTIVGTSGYMAPEQFMGHSAPATDLYSLGATIIHLASHTHPANIPLTRLRLDYHALVSCSPPLLRLIDDLIAPHIEERPASARDALERLDNLNTPATTALPGPTTPSAGRQVLVVALSLGIIFAMASLVFFIPDEEEGRRDASPSIRSPFDDEWLARKQAFERIDFSTKIKDSRLADGDLTMTDITPHISGFGDHVNVGVAIINTSSHALEALRADVSFVDEHGKTRATKTVDIHQSFKPTAQPGDRMHTDFQVPTNYSVREVVVALHSPQFVPTTSYTSPKTIALEWLDERPTGCALSAVVREESPPPGEHEKPRQHDLELAVTNSGTCPLQLISLEKRLYDADGNVIKNQQSYLNATYDPPLRPSEHLLVSLNSYLTTPFESYKVFVLRADLHDPRTK